MTEDAPTKRCPYCAEMIQEAAIVCRFCGRAMPGHEGEVPAAVKSARRPGGIVFVIAIVLLLGIVGVVVMLLTGQVPQMMVQIAPTPTITPVPTVEPCPVRAATFIKGSDELLTEWDDTNKLASSTARISLGPVVSKLQELRRKAATLETPSCAVPVRTLLVDYMDKEITVYFDFMAEKAEFYVNVSADAASKALDAFRADYKKLINGEAQYK